MISEARRPQSEASFIPTPQGCLTALLFLPVRLLSIAVAGFVARLRELRG
jgi:hypothetical protein